MTEINGKPNHNCSKCDAVCCHHVPVEIDTPTCKRDYDIIRWYLLHHNTRVFIDHYNTWHVEFMTPCKYLTEDYKCSTYANRPKLCRDYPDNETYCENVEQAYSILFSTVEEFDMYLDKKGVDWRWKKVICDFAVCAN